MLNALFIFGTCLYAVGLVGLIVNCVLKGKTLLMGEETNTYDKSFRSYFLTVVLLPLFLYLNYTGDLTSFSVFDTGYFVSVIITFIHGFMIVLMCLGISSFYARKAKKNNKGGKEA